MNNLLNKIRHNAGVFSEALFILCIVANSFTEASAQPDDVNLNLSYGATLAKEIVLRDAQTIFHSISAAENIIAFDWNIYESTFYLFTALPFIQISSAFEQNEYYVFNSASAP